MFVIIVEGSLAEMGLSVEELAYQCGLSRSWSVDVRDECTGARLGHAVLRHVTNHARWCKAIKDVLGPTWFLPHSTFQPSTWFNQDAEQSVRTLFV
jgi:hypothetical protein